MCALLELGWADQFALVAGHDRNHVHWLERLVSHVLSVVLRLQNFGSTFQRVVSIADIRTHLDWGNRLLSSFGAIPHCFGVQVCTWAKIPLNLQRLTCLECTPVAVSHDTNTAVDFVDADDAWQATNCGVVEALWLAADDWRHFDRSVDQTRHFDIDTELSGAVDFCRGVQTRDSLTNDVELASVFQLNFFWYRDRCSCRSELAVGCGLAATRHNTVLSRERGSSYAPLVGSSLDQHGAYLRAADTQLFPCITDSG